ncbi:flavodoxin reductase [Muricauda sp. NFXS6]|uniref:flavodoxin reductase n=1 Tax=Allomuricauda sp. NFXS6 TaxID=2819094 RepID=UPI0032DF8C0B
MKSHTVKIKSIELINYNVLRIVTEKPNDYNFEPGQATEISINQENWKDEKRPFTFTNLPTEDVLEFTIKVYPEHDGVTAKLTELDVGDELVVGDVFGAIKFKGNGIFLAGGAGVTPFIAIFKSLEEQSKMSNNTLIFANKTVKDIFLEDWFSSLLGSNFLNILSKEDAEKYAHGHIDEKYLKDTVSDFLQYFYVCGPPKMIESVVEDLKKLGAKDDKIVTEES